MVPCYLLFQIRTERGTWHITSGVIMDMSIVLLKPQEKEIECIMRIWKNGCTIQKLGMVSMSGANWHVLTIAVCAVLGLLFPMIFLPIEVSADQSTSQEYTEVLTPHEQNGMWGYTDRTGSIVIQPQWAVAGWYRGGTAAVCSTDGQWGIIDENGEYLVPCRYDSIWDQYSCYESTPFEDSNSYIGGLSDGFYIIIDRVDDEEYMGFFCISTKTLVEPQWFSVTIADEGIGINELVLVEDRDAGFGYVDLFGHVVIECQYDWATPFVEGVAQVGKWIDDDYYEYYIDTTGNEINLMMN